MTTIATPDPQSTERPELRVALHVADLAGRLLLDYFERGVAIEQKAAANLVSEADIEAERAIVAAIRSAFPADEILGEEDHPADLNAERLWVVDPLDGTNNFVHRIPHFAVSIAFYEAGQPQLGVVFNPARQDLYVASRGEGATHNGRPVAVSAAERLDEVLVAVGFYYDRGAMMEATLKVIRDLFGSGVHGIRRFGTAALDLCQVGAGLFGGYAEYHLAPWDFAAGRLFVEEAGGQVTTCRGDALPLAPGGVLASNGRLHAALAEITQRHHPG